jgi:hypothetical protein
MWGMAEHDQAGARHSWGRLVLVGVCVVAFSLLGLWLTHRFRIQEHGFTGWRTNEYIPPSAYANHIGITLGALFGWLFASQLCRLPRRRHAACDCDE